MVGAVATIVLRGMCPTVTGGGEATEMDAACVGVTLTLLAVIATIVLEDSHQTGVADMHTRVAVKDIGTPISHTSGGVPPMPARASMGDVGDSNGMVIIIIANMNHLARKPLMASPTLRSGGEILAYILDTLITVAGAGGRSTLEGTSGFTLSNSPDSITTGGMCTTTSMSVHMWGVGLVGIPIQLDGAGTAVQHTTFALMTGLTTAFRSGIMVIGSGYAKSKSTE